jgi:hypothetical protein
MFITAASFAALVCLLFDPAGVSATRRCDCAPISLTVQLDLEASCHSSTVTSETPGVRNVICFDNEELARELDLNLASSDLDGQPSRRTLDIGVDGVAIIKEINQFGIPIGWAYKYGTAAEPLKSGDTLTFNSVSGKIIAGGFGFTVADHDSSFEFFALKLLFSNKCDTGPVLKTGDRLGKFTIVSMLQCIPRKSHFIHCSLTRLLALR